MSGKLRWLGLAFVEFTTSAENIVIFDPWTKSKGNPSCPLEFDDLVQVDLILVSHDHEDHIGSAVDICQHTEALLGGAVETMRRLIHDGLPERHVVNNGVGYLTGGGVDLTWVKVVATPAHHTSETGCALGHIVIAADGTTVYHVGDTSLVAEMAIYGNLYPVDVAVVPVGGGGTMDAYQAAEAVRMIQPKSVLPIHFEWNDEPHKALDNFKTFCREKNPDIVIIDPVVGKYVNI